MITTQFQSSLITCGNCNARGALTLQAAQNGDAPPSFVSVTGSFHVETGRLSSGGIVIVCSQCDEIHAILPAAA